MVLENFSGVLIEEAFRLGKNMTNNEAKYEALFYGLELASKVGAQYLKANVDSELVSEQLIGTFEGKHLQMIAYYDRVKLLMSQFKEVKI